MSVLPGAEPFVLEPDGPGDALAGVVLCHGFTGSPQSMRPWGEALATAGFPVRCPRLPGHGTRWQDLNATRWEDWYGELERAFDAMLDRFAVVVVMGLSMGGTLTIRLAEQRPTEVAGIVLVNPSLTTLRKDAKFLPVLSQVVGSVAGIGSDIKKPGVKELAYARTPLRAANSLSHLWRLARTELPKVTSPVLLYRSQIDHVVESVNSQLLLDGVRSENVTEVVLKDSYHVATLDNDAETIFAGSAEFTRKLGTEFAGASS
ncbi:alpha/beta hydrolase [Fodinicola feengrottensis]|uniref:Alpha/beta fold hydrolase n=1 Tax=Fodinicola feengrottensis TaxID=435914 RepID=A0ABN2IF52_9ACTN|nr:alpha/beta fold hydrolase [Fodinicola feengrottensis]